MEWLYYYQRQKYMQTYYMVYIIVVLVFSIIFAISCGIIAKRKNRNVGGWTVLGFCFGFIALIIILCLPSLPNYEEIKNCIYCAMKIPMQASICPYCRKDLTHRTETNQSVQQKKEIEITTDNVDKIAELLNGGNKDSGKNS